MNRPTVVSVCGDPGGANALAPVLKVLAADGKLNVANYAYTQATDVLARQGIHTAALPGTIDPSWIQAHLQEKQATFLLTATSHNGIDWEKHFIMSARSLGIPSLAVLDFWSNYAVRFSDAAGNFCYLPDRVAVMDAHAQSQMIDVGIPPQNIIVTGQPAFDALVECRQQFSLAQRATLRESVGVGEHDLLVMFASQPIRELYGEEKKNSSQPHTLGPSLGFDQHSVLSSLVHGLEDCSKKYQKPISVLIRPHPREASSAYDDYTSDVIQVTLSQEGNSRVYAMAADLVVGMNTVLLVEACYLGCVVLSLQPGLRQADSLPTNVWGASIGVYHQEEIGPNLETLLFDEAARQAVLAKAATLKLDAPATHQVADYIYTQTLQSEAGE